MLCLAGIAAAAEFHSTRKLHVRVSDALRI